MDKNVLDLLNAELDNHVVDVRLPGEKEFVRCNLATVSAKFSPISELKRVYGEISQVDQKRIQDCFSDERFEAVYGVFIFYGKQVFAFNRLYSEYDDDRKEVVYLNLADAINSIIEAFSRNSRKATSQSSDLSDVIKEMVVMRHEFEQLMSHMSFSRLIEFFEIQAQ